ncbi:MAG: substrate-binding domain-containing protein [Deltaproteobacteria bacterium]|nr:substrate-binding domain-containing protein [Deltaproteobacteria bacterium]
MIKNQIAIMAASFAFTFASKMLSLISSHLKIGESLTQYSTVGLPIRENKRLEDILDKSPPSALIGVSIRPEASIVAKYKTAGIPIILIDEEMSGASTVASDNFMGGYLAGEYLVKKQRKKIAIVSGRMQIEGGYNAIQRVNGFKMALEKTGLALPQNQIFEVRDYSFNDGTKVMAQIIESHLKIDAIFCAAGDECAKGLLNTAFKQGVNIPEDISIIGYDDMELAKTSNPPLTTIRQPLEEMATSAYDMATVNRLELIDKPKKASFKPELIMRASA